MSVVYGAGHVFLINTEGGYSSHLSNIDCHLGKLRMELFGLGLHKASLCTVLAYYEESGYAEPEDPSAETMASWAKKCHGELVDGETKEILQECIMMGVLDTQQWRRQEHMREGSLHWSPLLRNGGRDDNLIRYVPEYYKSRSNAVDYNAEAIIYHGGYGEWGSGRDVSLADIQKTPRAVVGTANYAYKHLF
ncbi:hypothetical protein VHEMI01199 [[Torrubiella] hemipterigena]|uniref:Uncharacterized protein n=1 Tax=[Torrubiella] hemipterigena TaxID=1531966 RepID=A0A0A1T447_9HYPO|nr:hypothetical protein VHEMI01199 [[Torrubiella] hemipterigena]